MRWHSESYGERLKREAEWQKWFAWRPIRIDEYRVWLQWVMRSRGYLASPCLGWVQNVFWDYKFCKNGLHPPFPVPTQPPRVL